jgi:hypothetical protein
MKSTIFSLVIVLLLAVTSAFGQVLLVDGSVNPGQIPDTLAYRYVFDYTQTATRASASAKEAMIFTNQSDMVTFENLTAGFPAIKQQQSLATRDQLTAVMVSSLNQSLTPEGAAQLNSFVQEVKHGLKVYGGDDGTPATGYSSGINIFAYDPGSWDSYWDAFGTFTGGSYNGFCQNTPITSTMAYGGLFAQGVIDGLNMSATLDVNNTSIVPPGQSGEPGAGVVFAFTFKYSFVYWTHNCVEQYPITISLTTYEEIAYTKLIWTGRPGTDCFVVGGRTVCSYPVNPLCYNTKNPDYMPIGVNDDRSWPAWYSLASCNATTIDGSTVWFCIPLIAVGTTNITPANCTYNP